MIATGLMALLMQAMTAQQAFDAANALAERKDYAGALAGFEKVETLGPSRRTRGVVRIRQGETLRLLGREDEARTRLRDGVEMLKGDASLAALRAAGLEALAQSEELSFELASALAHYREALPAAEDDAARLSMLAGIARTAMFVDPPAGVTAAEQAVALAQTIPTLDGPKRALYDNLRGRALLNAGRAGEAKDVLVRATLALGGLTMKLDGSDLAARSDTAIAALRAGDERLAQRYLAFTGAGREGGFELNGDTDLPACGDGADDPHRDDVVVVQFRIEDDGAVNAVSPVYASRPGSMIEAFLHAVKDWSWRPEAAAEIRPFFRSAVRLELRCSTAAERPREIDLLAADMIEWFKARSLPPATDGEPRPLAARLDQARAELARREAASGRNAPALLPAIALMLEHPMLDGPEVAALAGRGRAIAAAAGAPPPVIAYFALRQAGAQLADSAGKPLARRQALREYETAVVDPVVAADGRSQGIVRLYAAQLRGRMKDLPGAAGHLDAIVADGRLGPRDPIKVGALVRLASLKARQGDLAGAQTAFAASGLDAAQCALVDAKPDMQRTGASSSLYPDEAVAWGFQGSTRNEFDIASDGRTRNVRTVMAYPPFVFGDASRRVFVAQRYTQTFRPGGAMGCGGLQANITFRLPDRGPPPRPKRPGDRAAANAQ